MEEPSQPRSLCVLCVPHLSPYSKFAKLRVRLTPAPAPRPTRPSASLQPLSRQHSSPFQTLSPHHRHIMSSNDKSDVALDKAAENNDKASPDTKVEKGAKRPAEDKASEPKKAKTEENGEEDDVEDDEEEVEGEDEDEEDLAEAEEEEDDDGDNDGDGDDDEDDA